MMESILQFLNEAFTMPTAVFSVLLSLVIVYWMVSLLGFSLESLEGGADGLADGVFDGVAEAALEGVTDGALDGAADGAFDGAAEGGLEGAGELGEPGLFERTGIGDMPKSFLLSAFVVFAWLFAFFGMRYLPQLLSFAFQGAALAVAVSALAVFFGLGATTAALVPLGRFFKLEPVTQRQDLVGRQCTVTTLRVTPSFGQAEIDTSFQRVEVRCEEPNPLARGSHALIYDYDREREAFLVSPIEESDLLPS